jgi:hypothetical protein
MCIVSQSASFSHSPPLLLLPAPKIAGLLPATVPPTPVYTILRPGEDDEPIGYDFPTPEEFDLDIYQTFARMAKRMAGVA